MSDDVRTTAIATDAILDLRPSEPMLPKLVKGLFDERQHGRWRTTQDNLYALVALTHYAKARSCATATVEATLGGKTVLAGDFRARPRTSGARRSPSTRPSQRPGPFISRRRGAGCTTRRCCASGCATSRTSSPTKMSMTVRREYLRTRPAAPPIDPKQGVKVGSVVRVRVTTPSPVFRNHLAVDDAVPAGLEPMNTRLVTTGGAPRSAERRGRGEARDLDAVVAAGFREMRDDRVLVFIDCLDPGPRRSTTWRGRPRRGRSWSRERRPRRCTSRPSRRGRAGHVRGEAVARMRRRCAPARWRAGCAARRSRSPRRSPCRRPPGGSRCTPGSFPRARLEPRHAASMTVLDADGNVLRQDATSAGGRETWVALQAISAHLRDATIASEDRRFWKHAGVDPVGVLRAAWLDLLRGRAGVPRLHAHDAAARQLEPRPRTLWGKSHESGHRWAHRARASNRDILEQYLNRVYYGNGAWGAEAAARFYSASRRRRCRWARRVPGRCPRGPRPTTVPPPRCGAFVGAGTSSA